MNRRNQPAASAAAKWTPDGLATELALANGRLAARRARDALPVRIDGKRLVLRPPMRADVPALVRLADNKRIAERLARLPSPYTRADAIGFVEIFAQRADERPYAVTLDGAFIGVVGFTFHPGEPAELGYWLGEPYWGKGYATEAVRALIEAAFATRQFREIKARALASNTASLGVLRKAGFVATRDGVEEIGQTRGQPVVFLSLEQPRWT